MRKNSSKEEDNNLNVKNVNKEEYDTNSQIRNVSCCFLNISVRNKGDYIIIYIHKEDDEKDVEAGNDKYQRSIQEQKSVVLYNLKDYTYKKWNPISKQQHEGDMPEVDYDSLIEVIKEIQKTPGLLYVKNERLDRFYYAIIYKMLKEGVFGVKNNDNSIRDFIDLMNINGLDSGKKSNLDEHLRKIVGKTPNLSVLQNDSSKSQETKNRKITMFIDDIVKRYQEKNPQKHSKEVRT